MKQLTVAGIALALAWSRPVAAEQQVRMATLAPAGTPWTNFLERAATEITEGTSGRITFKWFTGGQQGDERDYIRKISLGQLDGAAVTSLGLSLIDSSILVLQLPMLFTSEDEVDYVANKMWPHFQKKFAAKGFHLAERGELGWIYLFSKSKVASLADLQKQKLATTTDLQFASSLADRLKIQGVPLSIPEIDAALTSGRINACFSSPLGAIALQWYSKVRFMTSTPMVYGLGATVMSLSATKKFSAEDQKVIESVAKRNRKKARAAIRKANADAHKLMFKKGITIVDVPQEMVDQLTKIAVDVQAELVGKVYSKDELTMVIQYRDEFRAKQAKPAAK